MRPVAWQCLPTTLRIRAVALERAPGVTVTQILSATGMLLRVAGEVPELRRAPECTMAGAGQVSH